MTIDIKALLNKWTPRTWWLSDDELEITPVEAALLYNALAQEIADREEAERKQATLHAVLTVMQADWDCGGHLDPVNSINGWWPAITKLIPPEHRLLDWAVEEQQREREEVVHD